MKVAVRIAALAPHPPLPIVHCCPSLHVSRTDGEIDIHSHATLPLPPLPLIVHWLLYIEFNYKHSGGRSERATQGGWCGKWECDSKFPQSFTTWQLATAAAPALHCHSVCLPHAKQWPASWKSLLSIPQWLTCWMLHPADQGVTPSDTAEGGRGRNNTHTRRLHWQSKNINFHGNSGSKLFTSCEFRRVNVATGGEFRLREATGPKRVADKSKINGAGMREYKLQFTATRAIYKSTY